MLGLLGALNFLRKNWRLALCVAVLASLLGAHYFFQGQAVARAVSAERASWVVKEQAAALRGAQAQSRLDQAQAARVETRLNIDRQINTAWETARNAIHEAPDLSSAFAAHDAFVERLRNEAGARHAEALRDYAQSVASGGDGASGTAG